MPDAKQTWTDFYVNRTEMAFPPEGLIRLLKGGPYPGLSMPKPEIGQSIVDLGCGEGNAFPLYRQRHLLASGMEVSDEIVTEIKQKLIDIPIRADIRTGVFSAIPFDDNLFDYAVAWNSIYYMGLGTGEFDDHVTETARILKPGGWLICSIPTPDCFIFDNSSPDDDGCKIINEEFFGLRGGERMRCFDSTEEIEGVFSPHFTDFSHATIDIEWFGLRYMWFVFTARKKQPD